MTLSAPAEYPQGFHLKDGEVLLFAGSWDAFVIVEALCDTIEPRHRVSYLDGTIEVMAPPSPEHEHSKTNFGSLVENYFVDKDIEFDAAGEIRLKIPELSGSEPDESYYLHRCGSDHGGEIPDLVIEIKVTTGGLERLDIWAKFEVPEVWIHEEKKLRLFSFNGKHYDEVAESGLLPGIPIPDLEELCQIRPTSRAIKEFRKRISKK